MPNELVSLRITDDVLERIDKHASDLTEYTGVPIARADVIRKFIIEGLDRASVPKAQQRRK